MTAIENQAADEAAARAEDGTITVYRCTECMSEDVDEGAWIGVNNDKLAGRGPDEGPSSYYWCNGCNTELKYLEEWVRPRPCGPQCYDDGCKNQVPA